jgi:Tfp pilus assembly protein PilX
MINARLKLLLICNLSRQKVNSHRGFALPIALMVGMVILVVGVTMIIRAQGDQSKVISQTTSNKAMAIAEAGATRYVEFLNNNRGLIPYDSCSVVNTETGACADDTAGTTTTTTWVTAKSAVGKLTGIGGGTSPEPVGGTTSCNSSAGGGGTPPPSYQTVDSSTISSTWANATSSGGGSGWRNLPNDQNPEGQYRLVAYKVDRTGNWADPNNPPSNFSATLVVEGRVNVSGTGASATDAFNTGKARVAFTIPVTASTVTGGGGGGSGFPGLWARDFKFGGAGKAYSNVLDSSNCLTGTQAMPTAKVGNVPSNPIVASNSNNGSKAQYQLSNVAGTITPLNQGFPSLPTASLPSISDGSSQNITGIGWVNGLSCPYDTTITFPRNGDEDITGKTYGNSANPPAANATYAYSVCKDGNNNSITVKNDDITLGQSGQETFKFYTAGTVKLEANGNFVPKAGGTTKSQFYIAPAGWFEIGANGNIGLANDPTALQFYIYATDGGTINNGLTTGTNSMVQSILLGGNGSFYGFVFGPNANAKTGGTGDIAGSIWAKSYESGGNGGVVQGLFANSTRLDVSIPSGGNVTTYNLDGQPSSWQRTSLDTVAVPSVPTGITSTSAVQPSISWTANSTGATPNYYTLFRCQTTSANGTCTPGTPVKAYKQGSSTYSYAESFQPTASQRKFCYAATASNAGGDSARSSVVCGADKT